MLEKVWLCEREMLADAVDVGEGVGEEVPLGVDGRLAEELPVAVPVPEALLGCESEGDELGVAPALDVWVWLGVALEGACVGLLDCEAEREAVRLDERVSDVLRDCDAVGERDLDGDRVSDPDCVCVAVRAQPSL